MCVMYRFVVKYVVLSASRHISNHSLFPIPPARERMEDEQKCPPDPYIILADKSTCIDQQVTAVDLTIIILREEIHSEKVRERESERARK